jgi:transposase-like protein
MFPPAGAKGATPGGKARNGKSTKTIKGEFGKLPEFEAKWDKTHPFISQSWRRNWERITPFFAYPMTRSSLDRCA